MGRKKQEDIGQARVMNVIETHFAQFGKPPTVREIKIEAGLSSLCLVHAALVRLEEEGYITREKYKARAMKLTKKRMFV